MTKQQYKICKYLLKHDNLQKICKKFNLSYFELQDKLGVNAIRFSDFKMDNNTTIRLTDEKMDEFEQHRALKHDSVITRIVAILGAITGTVSLFVDLVQLFL